MTSLDPRAPLVLDTRELGRGPGSQLAREFTAVAPDKLGIDVLGVPEGSPVEIDVRLEAVMEGVLVTGEADVLLAGECARCLGPIEEHEVVRFQELYAYPERRDRIEAHSRGGEDDPDDETRVLEDDLLDLEPLLRDAVVLTLPFRPLCADDCPGLCAECGVRLADDPDHTHDAPIDPRWSALADLGHLDDPE